MIVAARVLKSFPEALRGSEQRHEFWQHRKGAAFVEVTSGEIGVLTYSRRKLVNKCGVDANKP